MEPASKEVSIAILTILSGLSSKKTHLYAYPSQDYILKCLAKDHGILISLRTLNRYLKRLEIDGYYIRVRRIKKGPDGRYHFKSTLYKLAQKIFKMAYKLSKILKRPFRAKIYREREDVKGSYKEDVGGNRRRQYKTIEETMNPKYTTEFIENDDGSWEVRLVKG